MSVRGPVRGGEQGQGTSKKGPVMESIRETREETRDQENGTGKWHQ